MGIMRLVEQKSITLNSTVAPLIDPFLKKINGTSMLELWNGDTTIEKLTIYQLLHMQGGLNDYDDHKMTEWTIEHPNDNYSPLDYLHALNKTFMCAPGTCEFYSSNGYEILGFVLAAHYEAEDWDSFDWWKIFPENLRSEYFKNTKFMKPGTCRDQDTVHTYLIAIDNQLPGLKLTSIDLDDDSCLNGWGFGNLAASASDVAKFYH